MIKYTVSKYLLIAFIILALNACALIAEQYTYVPTHPNEKPASMQFRVGTNEYPIIHIRKVDGKYLFDYGDTTSEAIKNNKILLSPGEHKLDLWVTANQAGGTFYALVNVKADVYYTLNVMGNKVWIEDTDGNVVYQQKFSVKTLYY